MHYIGSMGWSYNHWSGNFYSDNAAPREYLSEYSKQFNSVEINSTFYRIPSRNTVQNWKKQTPNGFKFAVKMPQSITHVSQMGGEEGNLEIFLEFISILGSNLGPILIQFPLSFKEDRYRELIRFLSTLPDAHRYSVEFRDKSWFKEEVYRSLREANVSLVLVDHPWLPELDVHTADFTYIRWQGDRKKVDGEKGLVELDRGEEYSHWAEKLAEYHNIGDVYGYFSKFFSGHPPTDIRMLNSSISSALS